MTGRSGNLANANVRAVTPIAGEPPVVLLCPPPSSGRLIAKATMRARRGGAPRINSRNNDYGIKPALLFSG
jgi:hypothetical protein